MPTAERERDHQIAYVGERSPQAAIRIGDAIERAVARLVDYPHSGRPGRIKGSRELVVAGTPYIVVYRVETSAIVILRVLHGAQRWPRKL